MNGDARPKLDYSEYGRAHLRPLNCLEKLPLDPITPSHGLSLPRDSLWDERFIMMLSKVTYRLQVVKKYPQYIVCHVESIVERL